MDTAGMPTRLAARLARGRAAAEARMGAANGGSDGVVKRRTGSQARDPFTGLLAPTWSTVHEGPFRLAGNSSGASPSRTINDPGGEITSATRRADWPVGVPRFKDGDVITVTAGENVGTKWLVGEADSADQQTAYRVPVSAYL